ncbi:MAG: hypothetical protein ACK4TB_05400 [Gemmobacter sp.]
MDDGFGNPILNPTTMTMVTPDTFFFRYSMNNPVDNDFSDITVNPSSGRLHDRRRQRKRQHLRRRRR